MKKSILVLTVFLFVGGMMLTSCETPAQRVQNAESDVVEAEEDVVEAEEELSDAREDYLNDVERYKEETAERIEENNQRIAEFKERTEAEKNETRADYKTELARLEKQNNDLKSRLSGYSAEGKSKWETFKTNFARDMEQLGDEISDLTTRKND